MRHPTEGVLRRMLDEPAAVADSDREHAVSCGDCLYRLAVVREDAALIGASLATEGATDVSAAWLRLSTVAPANGTGHGVTPPPPAGRVRELLRRPAIAALAVAVVLAGGGVAAANDWLQVFRTEQIAPLSLSTADLVALPDLTDYGDVVVTEEVDVRDVPDATAAAAATGLDVPEVTTLPSGVVGDPVYQVGSKASATFTFSAERAEAAATTGESLPPVPPGVDGSEVRLVVGPGVGQIWRSSAGAPALVVGRAVAPTAFSSSGVAFETVRDYLLSLPGIPDDVAADLRTFSANGSTLPLPVPAEQVTTSSEQVDGATATVLTTRDRTLAAVVWVDDGVVTAVAGSLDADEVLSIARELQ